MAGYGSGLKTWSGSNGDTFAQRTLLCANDDLNKLFALSDSAASRKTRLAFDAGSSGPVQVALSKQSPQMSLFDRQKMIDLCEREVA